jgi:hypothetical protein
VDGEALGWEVIVSDGATKGRSDEATKGRELESQEAGGPLGGEVGDEEGVGFAEEF